MKISKIYSNNSRFNDLDFTDGLNIILGRVINQQNLESDSHNLGKSTLINLIDFMFLKGLKTGNFLKDNIEKFSDYTFFMELKKNNSQYITIKRSVKNNTKISLKFHNEGKQDFREELAWDYKDLPLTSSDVNKNPKEILNRFWGFSELLPYDYRQYINYFLRTQYDYDEVFKLTKFRGSDSSWKPAIAQLLGFNGALIKEKYLKESEIKDELTLFNDMEQKLKINLNQLNQIKSLLDISEAKKEKLLTKIDDFDFYMNERELNRELIEEIETNISKLNSKEYKLKYEIKKTQESLRNSVPFDISKLQTLFSEIKIFFPNELKKEYGDLVKFNNDITEERNLLLEENLAILQKDLEYVNNKLRKENKRRNEILSLLKEKDSFTKFKKYQMELVEVENEISNLLSKMDNYDLLKEMDDAIKAKEATLQNIIDRIEHHLNQGNNLFKQIAIDFSQLVLEILGETAILFYEINDSKNVEFRAKIIGIDEAELTSKSDGYSYRKMLCVCFDLAVLINYPTEKFYQFAYHDGSLESLSNTKKIKYINKIRELCSNNGIQYIFTALEDDIPRNSDDSLYKIYDNEITITLDDRENNEGRLFGMSF
ncbi:DUF2326 domain-containing protein [Bacillus paralicheniformis]|uniref:DUF2326 domain-containing protein n=1 Tax=Bacillus paralicheniformis TaxID=1648923 RepID=UPI000BA77303|nr:DUF2326 domain-containing protein [Bacillus paralicheniformis]PAC95365.1 hypothetical protein CHH86_19975 [Bacillus paralicheniformis]